MVVDSHQPQCLKGVLGPWRRANLLSSPRWVHATEEMVVLVYAMLYMYMESDPKPKESGTGTSTATPFFVVYAIQLFHCIDFVPLIFLQCAQKSNVSEEVE